MSSIFWFALVVGGGLLLLSLIGDIFGGDIGDVGDLGDAGDLSDLGDASDTATAAGDAATTAGGTTGTATHAATSWLAIFSLRNLTYLLFGFGLAGVVLDYLWEGARPVTTILAAGVTGLLAARLNALLLGYIRRTESGAMAGDAALTGLPARITLPLAAGSTGKIEVERSGRAYELLARPYGTPATDPAEWGEVVVVELEDGVALVVPLENRK
jgi:hypothetical protein